MDYRPLALVVLLAGCVLPSRRESSRQATEKTDPVEQPSAVLRAERSGRVLTLQLVTETTRTWQERTGRERVWQHYEYSADADFFELLLSPVLWAFGAADYGVPGFFYGLIAALPTVNLGGAPGTYGRSEPTGEVAWDPWEPKSEVTESPIAGAAVELLAADGVTLLTVTTGPDGRASVDLHAERARLFGGDLPPANAFAPDHGARCALDAIAPPASRPDPADDAWPPDPSAGDLPAWFGALAAERRPPLPLPPGLQPADRPGEYVNERDGSVLVYVPPGTFRMGCRDGEPRGGGVRVRLTRGYYLGKHEVTWGQYRLFCRETSRPMPGPPGFPTDDEHPVVNVSWSDAQEYCAWAGLRLPTEAEWEHGARGSDGRAYPWGNDAPDTGRVNSSQARGGTMRVGSFPGDASPFGALDMAGNAREWVADWYEEQPSPSSANPAGPATGTARAFRGGSWFHDAWNCRGASRAGIAPGGGYSDLGVRVARSAED